MAINSNALKNIDRICKNNDKKPPCDGKWAFNASNDA